jgi:phosphoribosyl-ATP pyrophosphohydrolase/phosphoribosyl-AMP cyclohydrolase
MSWLDQVKFDARGLVPVAAQEAVTGELLMLAYANRDALEKTFETGRAHYWSRSRDELWAKGDTSGHIQEVVEVRLDCDGDTILYRVRQTGPACHTGERSCFYRVVGDEGELTEAGLPASVLDRIDGIIQARRLAPEEGSYTNYLLEKGIDKILKKLGEEATEVVIAAKNANAEEIRSESADLVYHLLVMLQERGVPLNDLLAELDSRFGRAPRQRSGRDRGEI